MGGNDPEPSTTGLAAAPVARRPRLLPSELRSIMVARSRQSRHRFFCAALKPNIEVVPASRRGLSLLGSNDARGIPSRPRSIGAAFLGAAQCHRFFCARRQRRLPAMASPSSRVCSYVVARAGTASGSDCAWSC